MFSKVLSAQDLVWLKVINELKKEKKSTHWMWFVFPQLKGLGKSFHSDLYGLNGWDDAKQYLDHAVLGPRLIQCVQILLHSKETDPKVIFGFTDAKKLKSSMTLFSLVDNSEEQLFSRCLDKFFDGQQDYRTIEMITQSKPNIAQS